MNRYIDAEWLLGVAELSNGVVDIDDIYNAPTIDVVSVDLVRCKDCKHRPIKEDANGENYGFNLIEPTEGDERCPCLVSDGWYSWMPKDDFYCSYGERKESE